MRHRKLGRKFGRKKDQRKALLKSLCYSLIKYKKIKTTEARAKDLRRIMDRLMAKAKDPTLTNIRYLRKYFDKNSVKELVNIAKSFDGRKSGFLTLVKLPVKPSNPIKLNLVSFCEQPKINEPKQNDKKRDASN